MPDILFSNKPLNEGSSGSRLSQGTSLGMLVSIVLFIMALAVYGALFAVNRTQSKNLQKLDDDVKGRVQSLRSDYFDQVFVLQDQLKSIRARLNDHVFGRNILTILEADTHAQVQFSTFNFDSQTAHLDMAGEAASFSVFAKQMSFLQQDTRVKSVEFGGLSVDPQNHVHFNLTITFDPSVLHVLPITLMPAAVSPTPQPSPSPTPQPSPSPKPSTTPIASPKATPKPKVAPAHNF